MMRGIFFWVEAKNAEIGRIGAVGVTRTVAEVTINFQRGLDKELTKISTTDRAQQRGTLLIEENSTKPEADDRRRLVRGPCCCFAWSCLRRVAELFIGRLEALSTRATESSMARQEALPNDEAPSSLMAAAHDLRYQIGTFDPAMQRVRALGCM